jgi:hypothetical protein
MGGWLYAQVDVTSTWYGFWSGPGSIIERLIELAVIGGILWRKHNCHQPGCPRIGRFPDGQWHVCRRHHPHDQPGADRGQ